MNAIGKIYLKKIVSFLNPDSRILICEKLENSKQLTDALLGLYSSADIEYYESQTGTLNSGCYKNKKFDIIIAETIQDGHFSYIKNLLAPAGILFLNNAEHAFYDEAKKQLVEYGHIGSFPDNPGAYLWWGGSNPIKEFDNPAENRPLIICFFTKGTEYELEAKRLESSCLALGLDSEIVGVDSLGSWVANCSYKPFFIRDIWKQTKRPVLWVDADGMLLSPPDLLAATSADFAVHKWKGNGFASGTVFFKQSEMAGKLLDQWCQCSKDSPEEWDQVTLETAWNIIVKEFPLETIWLPESYCYIFDSRNQSITPVIKHFQASRRFKETVGGEIISPAASVSAKPDYAAIEWKTKTMGEAMHFKQPSFVETYLYYRFINITNNSKSIAIYGTGKHTEFILDLLPVSMLDHIEFFIDDNAGSESYFYRWKVHSPQAADFTGIDTVVLSSDTYEDKFFEACKGFLPERIQIERLYHGMPVELMQENKFNRLQGENLQWIRENASERMDAIRAWNIFAEPRWQFHLDRYKFACRNIAGKLVGDIACGTGYGTEILAKRGNAAKSIGIDIDPKAIRYATLFHSDGPCEYISSDACSLPLRTGFFDAVCSFESIEHVDHPELFVSELARVLKKNGVLICSVPNNLPLKDAKFHKFVFDYESFVNILSPYFSIEESYNQNSGDNGPFNRRQPRGMVLTNNENKHLAECFIAVCKKK